MKDEIFYKEHLSMHHRFKIYKRSVEEFCEYMEIPMGVIYSFCDLSHFLSAPDWGESFLRDVGHTSSLFLCEILDRLEKGGSFSWNVKKLEFQIRILLRSWVLSYRCREGFLYLLDLEVE